MPRLPDIDRSPPDLDVPGTKGREAEGTARLLHADPAQLGPDVERAIAPRC